MQLNPHDEEESAKNSGKMGRKSHGISGEMGKLLSLSFTLATFPTTKQNMPLGVVTPFVTVLRIRVEIIHFVELFCFNLGG